MPALTNGRQRALDFRGTTAAHFQQYMRARQVGGQVERATLRQAVAVHQAGVMLLKQRRGAQFGGHIGEDPGRQVDIAIEHAVHHPFTAGLDDLQVDAGRFTA